MALNDSQTIFGAVTREITARIIALTFIELRGDVPTPTMDQIRQTVATGIGNAVMTEGSTFSGIVRSLSVSCDGNPQTVDKALETSDHVRYQIKEIAHVLAPIVVQSIRALDQFQTEADEILFHLQDEITSKITQDHTQANFEITEVDLGVLDDADALNTAAAVSEQYLPNPDRTYMAHEYRSFARRIPFHILTPDEKSELNKFLMENDLYNETLRHALSTDVSESLLFPDDLRSPKVQADYLSTLWNYGTRLKSLLQALPEDGGLDENIVDNINGFIARLSLAIHWGRYVVDHNNKNSLIAGHDSNAIYVYPWAYNSLDNEGVEDKEETVKNFVRAKLIQKVDSPVGGYTVKDVLNSRKSVGSIMSEYRRQTVLDQKAHTKAVVKEVVQENLKDYPVDWIIKITNDLVNNSEATLSDILAALINRCGDYYLAALYNSTETEEFSTENPNAARANVVLNFLITVARDRIIAPQA